MNEFEKAKLKGMKRHEANKAYRAQEEAVAKKEAPRAVSKPPMTVKVDGPVGFEFTVITSGEIHPDALMALFKKQLSVFGRVL